MDGKNIEQYWNQRIKCDPKGTKFGHEIKAVTEDTKTDTDCMWGQNRGQHRQARTGLT